MKVSIVTSYHNRKNLFLKTLESIKKSEHKNFEVIVVDDCSDEEHRLEDILTEYNFINLIRLEKKDKWYLNPCVPFNIGFKNVSGDIVIIQNPECYHTSDIISYTINNLSENDYFSFGCFSLDQINTNFLHENKSIKILNNPATKNGDNAWYNHSKLRPTGYHFTSAIFKNKLDLLNGFDERYALGYEYDDNEFLHRVKKICDFKYVDTPYVLHQWHGDVTSKNNFKELSDRNRDIFLNQTLKEDKIKVNEK